MIDTRVFSNPRLKKMNNYFSLVQQIKFAIFTVSLQLFCVSVGAYGGNDDSASDFVQFKRSKEKQGEAYGRNEDNTRGVRPSNGSSFDVAHQRWKNRAIPSDTSQQDQSGADCGTTKETSDVGRSKLFFDKPILYDTSKQEQSVTVEASSPETNEIRMVLIGKTGSGKSATGNTILGNKYFTSRFSLKSITENSKLGKEMRFDKNIVLVDTPGIFDTNFEEKMVREEISRCIRMTTPGLHAFIYVITIGRFTKEEYDSLKILEEIFGDRMFKYMILLFPGLDNIERDGYTFEECLKETDEFLIQLLKRCGNRCIAFDNATSSQDKKDQMVEKLLEMVDNILKENGTYYTNKDYIEAEIELRKATEIKLREEQRRHKQECKEIAESFELKRQELIKEMEKQTIQFQKEISRLEKINAEAQLQKKEMSYAFESEINQERKEKEKLHAKTEKLIHENKENVKNLRKENIERINKMKEDYQKMLDAMIQQHEEEIRRTWDEAIRDSTKKSPCIIL